MIIADRYNFYTCYECKTRMKSTSIKPYTRICYKCYEKYTLTTKELDKIQELTEALYKIML